MESEHFLKHLNTCDVYRDGGSYGAIFTTADGEVYRLWLERHPLIFETNYSGPRHHYLFENWDWNLPPSEDRGFPVVSGSAEEQGILDRLVAFIQSPGAFGGRISDPVHLATLAKMIKSIQERSRFSPENLPDYQLDLQRCREKQKLQIQQAKSQWANEVSCLTASLRESEHECQFAACHQRALTGRKLCAEHLLQPIADFELTSHRPYSLPGCSFPTIRSSDN